MCRCSRINVSNSQVCSPRRGRLSMPRALCGERRDFYMPNQELSTCRCVHALHRRAGPAIKPLQKYSRSNRCRGKRPNPSSGKVAPGTRRGLAHFCTSVRALKPGPEVTGGDTILGPRHRRVLLPLGGACSTSVSARAAPPHSRRAWLAERVMEEDNSLPRGTRRCERRDTSESRASHAWQAMLG